ncbi:hypothetical protein [Aquipseudomonas alcaligenes]|uniref:Uncharacterized protein n=1 Tax=Aquipseudomonas alcaligenes TaxID=43263 RepID=A0AA42N2J2_AQUAC|nr:hypothetical protein [Pseudomonas alcaligenes]MDH1054981.1 hypothetical protein [Pseudomonas alcaligenes]
MQAQAEALGQQRQVVAAEATVAPLRIDHIERRPAITLDADPQHRVFGQPGAFLLGQAQVGAGQQRQQAEQKQATEARHGRFRVDAGFAQLSQHFESQMRIGSADGRADNQPIRTRENVRHARSRPLLASPVRARCAL